MIEGHLFFLQNVSISFGISNAEKVLNPWLTRQSLQMALRAS